MHNLELLTKQLIAWSFKNNKRMIQEGYGPNGPVPCGNCDKEMYEDDEVIVARNIKKHTRAIFCSETCQRQYLFDVRARG